MRGLGTGLIAGAVGLVAMELVQRLARPLVRERAPKPTDIFLSERTMSPLGPQHLPGEGSTAAVGRIAYEKLVGKPPPRRIKSALSWGVHIGYGLGVAALYVALRRGRDRDPLRDGVAFGAALWLFGDELAVPLLGLTDKPTMYSASQHARSLAGHLGFGIATAQAARRLEEMR
jgi:hypothetical protein